VDFGVSLNLVEIARIEPLFFGSLNPKFLDNFRAACKFYSQALQIGEQDPEVGYLHLVTAGELLSNYFEHDTELLLDGEMISVITLIRKHIPKGDKAANLVISRLLQIKRKFVDSICDLLDDSFFERTESQQPYGRLVATDIRKVVSAAYDLRSKYVHTGVPFGNWIRWSRFNNEVQFGRPITEDKEFSDILAKAPTYVGLERIIRYCLLQFAAKNGAFVELPREVLSNTVTPVVNKSE